MSTTLIESDLSEDAINRYCDEFFREAPIKFKCRKGNKLEEHVQKLIKKHKITVPIVNVKQQNYLVGSAKVNLEFKFQ